MLSKTNIIKNLLLGSFFAFSLILATISFSLYSSSARNTDKGGAILGDNTSNFALIKCGVGQSLTQGADAVWTCSDNPIDQITASNGITKSGNSLSLITCPAGQIIKSDGTTYQCSSDLTGDSSSTSSNSYTASNGIVLQGTNLSPNYGTTANTIAQGNDSRFHDPLTIGTGNGLSLANQVLSLGLASSTQNGALSSSDWNSFNNKVSSQWANYNTGIQYNSGTVLIGDVLPPPSLIPYNASTLTGAAISLSLGDDDYSSEISLPFTFKLYNDSYNSLFVDSNGYISFGSGYSDNSTIAIPSSNDPNAMIAGFLTDLDPTSGGTIKYETLGSTPNRIFVVEFNDIPMYNSTGIVSFQIKLFETSNNVEIHTLDISNPDNYDGIQGIENASGTSAKFIPGRNNISFTLNNDGVRFAYSASTYNWGSGSLAVENTITAESYITSGSYINGSYIDTNSVYKINNQAILHNEGSNNLFLGVNTGQSNTHGSNNSFIGFNSGYSNDYGNNNSFLGYNSGYNNTGDDNSFIGFNSGYNNTYGENNTFLGSDSGYSNTSGDNDTFIGSYSGYSNTTGNYNSFIGYQSGVSNTTGEANSFLGFQSGFSNTTGGGNIFIGSFSGRNNTTGIFNSFIGYQSGYSNTTGTANSFIGYQAGYNETGSNKLYIANSNTSTPLIYGDFSAGALTINGTGGLTLASSGSFLDFASSTNGNTFIEKIPQKATNGTCASAASEGLIFQNTGNTQVGHMCISGPTAGSPNKLAFYADSFNATSTDLAENYSDKDNLLSSGDIVILDDLTSKGVKKASQTGDSLLLGIVSTDPGLKLSGINEDGTTDLINPKAVALSGRVPVKVTTKNGVIKKGDLITSSDIPGVGQKATTSGFVVGKALEDYAEIDTNKVGKILVFVNLTYFSPGQILTSNDIDIVLSEKYTALETRVTKLEARVQDIENKQLNGEATLKADDTTIEIVFDKAYLSVPNIILTPNNNIIGTYYVDNKTTQGFTIKLSQVQKSDVKFDWVSLVKN